MQRKPKQNHKPLREVACLSCRRRKKRCSKEHPACSHCALWNLPCQYPDSAKEGLDNYRSTTENLDIPEHFHATISHNVEGDAVNYLESATSRPGDDPLLRRMPDHPQSTETKILPLWTSAFFRKFRESKGLLPLSLPPDTSSFREEGHGPESQPEIFYPDTSSIANIATDLH